MDLRSLHAELLGDRVPEPELSIGMALAHGVQIRDALSGWRWTLGETRAGDASTVLYAQVLTDRASRMTGAAAELYTHVVVLERHVRETYLAGLSYAAGAEFLRRADEDQDQLVQRLGEIADHEGAETWGGTYAVARAAARSRTFLRATDEDRAPDLFGPDEESERATFEI